MSSFFGSKYNIRKTFKVISIIEAMGYPNGASAKPTLQETMIIRLCLSQFVGQTFVKHLYVEFWMKSGAGLRFGLALPWNQLHSLLNVGY